MTGEGLIQPPEQPFDVAHLKTLPRDALVAALESEALATSEQLPDDKRKSVAIVMHGLQMKSESVIRQIEDRLFEELTTKPDESETNSIQEDSPERVTSRIKAEIQAGLQKGVDIRGQPWTDSHTNKGLQKICERQWDAGYAIEGYFVRQTAFHHLSSPGLRGIMLLKNAVTGDQLSYGPGIEALHIASNDESLSRTEAVEGLEMAIDLMSRGAPGTHDILSDLALDMLARLREWNTEDRYRFHYAIAATRLAVAFRDRPITS